MGKMDALYHKVGLYDTLRDIICYGHSSDRIDFVQEPLGDIAPQMLHFLENHDEQRIASEGFAGEARYGLPAMTLTAHLSQAAVMLYFGQEVGEPAREHAGFGAPTRTSIFDYIGVPAHQGWVNGKRYDGGGLTPEQASLRDFYCRLLRLPIKGISKIYIDIIENIPLIIMIRYIALCGRKNSANGLYIVISVGEDTFGFDLTDPSCA